MEPEKIARIGEFRVELPEEFPAVKIGKDIMRRLGLFDPDSYGPAHARQLGCGELRRVETADKIRNIVPLDLCRSEDVRFVRMFHGLLLLPFIAHRAAPLHSPLGRWGPKHASNL